MPATNPTLLNRRQRLLQTVLLRVRPAPVADVIKRLLGVRRLVVETAEGLFWVDPVSKLGRLLTLGDRHEPPMCRTLEYYLGPGRTFVDLGANEGFFTVIGARLCAPGGTVLAVEPQERLLPVIEENLRLNHCQGACVVNAAVTDHEGLALVHLAPSTATGGSSLRQSTKYPLPKQKVRTLTLAHLLDREVLATVDLMKVDIEGHEHEAILGSPEVFRQHRVRHLVLEVHPSILKARGKDAADITRLLKDCGYTVATPFGPSVWSAPEAA